MRLQRLAERGERAANEGRFADLPILMQELEDEMARVREWLMRAMVKGTSNDVRLMLRGNLADFPYPQGRSGQFVVAIKGRDATLDYADHWPPVSDVEADLRFEGSRLTIDVARGRVLGASLGRAHLEVPDLREHPATLKVEG